MTVVELQWLQRAPVTVTQVLIRDEAGRIVGLEKAGHPRPAGNWDTNFHAPRKD